MRISGVHTGIRRSKKLVLRGTTDGIENNNKTIFYFLLLN